MHNTIYYCIGQYIFRVILTSIFFSRLLTVFEKKVFDNQMCLLNELSNMKQLLAVSTSNKFVAALPGDCPDLPAKDFQEVLSLEKYLATDSYMEQMVSGIHCVLRLAAHVLF